MADYAIHDTTLEAIADTIRKKDGSVALIDPADYADRINLMGMLEEKTVSGHIAQFSDGADDVPMVVCECDISASISGKYNLELNHTNYNMIDWENVSASSSTTLYKTVALPVGEYYFYVFCETQSFNRTYQYKPIDGSGSWTKAETTADEYCKLALSSNSYNRGKNRITVYKPILMRFGMTINSNSKDKRIDCLLTTDGSYYATASNSNLPIGGTIYDTYYVSYVGEKKTVDFVSSSSPINGGSIDVISGTGTVDCCAPKALSTLTWNKFAISGNDCFVAYLSDAYIGQTGSALKGACDNTTYTFVDDSSGMADQTIYIGQNGSSAYVIIRDDQYASLTGEEFAEVVQGNVVYELALSERTSFTFDPISLSTYKDDNVLWNNAGDTSVTYRSAGTKQTYPNAEEASF